MKYTDTGEPIIEDFEDWVSIHGEPEYEDDLPPPHPVNIKVIPYTEPEEPEDSPDFSQCVYTDDKGSLHINYNLFARGMIQINNLICYKGMFFNPFREVTSESLRRDISETLVEAGWTGKLDGATSSIIQTMRDLANVDHFSGSENTIYFQNGELDITSEKEWVFREGVFSHTPYRLNCNFVYKQGNMPMFSKWVTDVFENEDIDTLQQILGYCLTPLNKVQEAFILVGSAGVGKSVLTYLLYDIFREGYVALNITELDENKFILANIENKLIVYDDDLQTRALTDTGIFKKLITSEQPIKAERKGQQPYMFIPRAKVICNTNAMIQSLYDDSEGFFRRLHPIVVKEKKPGRRNIVDMNKLVAAEKDNIIRWALQGLWDLRRHHYQMHWSDRSREFLETERNPFKVFFDTCFTVTDNAGDTVKTEDIIRLYGKWCKKNGMTPFSNRRLTNWLGTNEDHLKIIKKQIGKERLKGYGNLVINEAWSKYIPK